MVLSIFFSFAHAMSIQNTNVLHTKDWIGDRVREKDTDKSTKWDEKKKSWKEEQVYITRLSLNLQSAKHLKI